MTIFQGNRALLLSFRAGDPEALATVYWHYVSTIERLLRRGFQSGEVRVPGLADPDVRDVLQDTFARAFSAEARKTYDGLRPFSAYLIRIARNLVIDRVRVAGRVELDPDAGLHTDADEDRPDEVVAQGQLQAATQQFLAGLDEETRELVRLRFEQERSQEEVAAQMNVSRRRVRTLEQRVRRALHEHLTSVGLGAELAHEGNLHRHRPSREGEP